MQDVDQILSFVANGINDLRLKMSMPDSVIQIKNAVFYLPNFPADVIQRYIVSAQDYWDMQALNIINKYLKPNSTILDIGANIGSHTVYWCLEKQAKKVYAFEPLGTTFDILKRNVELNNIDDRVELFNIGLSNIETNASVSNYNIQNIGNTSFKPDDNGQFKLKCLDSIKIKEKIDLIKIDVEGAEVEVLHGALSTIRKDNPIIVIESFNHKQEIDNILMSLGYKLSEVIRQGEDYIYIPLQFD